MKCAGQTYWTEAGDECPRCPEHPEILLHLVEPDHECIRVLSEGGELHGVCLYGCEVLLSVKAVA